jgi:uncharacterized protein YndB with AHSA1/START domain
MAGDAVAAYSEPVPAAVVHVTRTFAAPRERVFRAWTEPEAVSRWFGAKLGPPPSVEADVRAGGRYLITMRAPIGGRRVTVGGTYLEVDPPERLVYTFAWRGMPPAHGMGDSKVTVEFRELGAGTEVRLTHELLDKRRIRGFHTWGWRVSMRRLGRLL